MVCIRFLLTIMVTLYFYFIILLFLFDVRRVVFIFKVIFLALMSGRKRPEKPPVRRRQVAQLNTDMAPSRCQAKRHLRRPPIYGKFGYLRCSVLQRGVPDELEG